MIRRIGPAIFQCFEDWTLGAFGKCQTGPVHRSQGLSNAWQGLSKSRSRALLAVNQTDTRRQGGWIRRVAQALDFCHRLLGYSYLH